MQVVFGAAGGAALGLLLSATRVWNTEQKRLLTTYSSWCGFFCLPRFVGAGLERCAAAAPGRCAAAARCR
jgi:hypothetical protein